MTMAQFKRHMFAALLVGLSMATASVAQSNEPDGAIADWLNNDDPQSLPQLSELANSGDWRAQILLGQVDRDIIPGGYSTYLRELDRADRAALLRSPQENGKTANWLLNLSNPDVAGAGEALFWYEANLDVIEAAEDLAAQSEPAMAHYLLWKSVNNGSFDLMQAIPQDEPVLTNAGFLLWLRDYFAQPDGAITLSAFLADRRPEKMEGLLALKRLERLLNLQSNFSLRINEVIEVVRGNSRSLNSNADLVALDATLSAIAQVDQRLAVVERLCERCPNAAQEFRCMPDTLAVIGGYNKLMQLRTPSENIIPADVFLQSERAVTTLENVIYNLGRSGNFTPASQCVADIIDR